MFNGEKQKEVERYLKNVAGKVYIGCDSVKFKKFDKWYARYATVLIVHINDINGCKIFGDTIVERDYDQTSKKLRMRLMKEVYLVADCFMKFVDVLADREVEIHLDINPKKTAGSSIVISEACGYILGMTGINPKTKPEAFAASYAADAYAK